MTIKFLFVYFQSASEKKKSAWHKNQSSALICTKSSFVRLAVQSSSCRKGVGGYCYQLKWKQNQSREKELSRAATLDAAILAWTMEVFRRTRFWIPVQQHKLLILLLSLPPPPVHYVKSEPKDTILLCKNACILTSARKGYFQFTLLDQLANFYSSHFKENTIHFYSLFYHMKAFWALRCKLRCLCPFYILREVHKTQEPSLVQIHA